MLRLTTPRLVLRNFNFSDSQDIVRLHQDTRVTSLLVDYIPLTQEDAIDFLAQYIQWHIETKLGGFHISDRTTRAFLGMFHLIPFGDTGEYELGTRLMPAAWGRGLAIEAGTAVVNYGFARTDCPYIVSITGLNNDPVIFDLARAGYAFEGNIMFNGKRVRRFALHRQAWVAQGSVPLSRRAGLEQYRAWRADFDTADAQTDH